MPYPDPVTNCPERVHLPVRSLLLTLAVAGMAVLASGCLVSERANALHSVTSSYTYDLPLEEVWPVVRTLLLQNGYVIRAGSNDFAMMTEWQQHTRSTVAGAYSRYYVEGFRLAGDRCQVRAFKQQSTIQSELQEGPVDLPVPVLGAHQSSLNSHTLPGVLAPGASDRLAIRDLEFEWEVLRATEPDMAQRIEMMVDYNRARADLEAP